MKTVWKWVIGIVVVLVILAVVVGGAFLLRSHMMNILGVARLTRPGTQVPGNRQLPAPNNGTNGTNGTNGNGVRRFPGMMPFGFGNWGGRGMYMGGGMLGLGRMMPFAGFFGGLISLGVLVLIVLAIIWLVRNLRKPVATVAVVNPVAPAAATHPCQKCREPVQADWQFCPHCGEKQ